MSRISGTVGMNGTATRGTRGAAGKRSRGKGGKHKAMVGACPRLALGITVGMGVGIPGLTLALTTVAGGLAMAGHGVLAASMVGVCGTVLAVSLSHLAWAIQDITKSPVWASWALAIAVDLSVVLSEASHVFADGVCAGLVQGIMVAVTLASMALNVWAFLRHR